MSVHRKSAKPSLSLDDLKSTLTRVVPGLAPGYGLKRLSVFGSRLTGKLNRRSDVDLLVDFGDTPLSLLKFIELKCRLADELGVTVDLVEERALKPRIGNHIRSEAVQIWPAAETT